MKFFIFIVFFICGCCDQGNKMTPIPLGTPIISCIQNFLEKEETRKERRERILDTQKKPKWIKEFYNWWEELEKKSNCQSTFAIESSTYIHNILHLSKGLTFFTGHNHTEHEEKIFIAVKNVSYFFYRYCSKVESILERQNTLKEDFRKYINEEINGKISILLIGFQGIEHAYTHHFIKKEDYYELGTLILKQYMIKSGNTTYAQIVGDIDKQRYQYNRIPKGYIGQFFSEEM